MVWLNEAVSRRTYCLLGEVASQLRAFESLLLPIISRLALVEYQTAAVIIIIIMEPVARISNRCPWLSFLSTKNSNEWSDLNLNSDDENEEEENCCSMGGTRKLGSPPHRPEKGSDENQAQTKVFLLRPWSGSNIPDEDRRSRTRRTVATIPTLRLFPTPAENHSKRERAKCMSSDIVVPKKPPPLSLNGLEPGRRFTAANVEQPPRQLEPYEGNSTRIYNRISIGSSAATLGRISNIFSRSKITVPADSPEFSAKSALSREPNCDNVELICKVPPGFRTMNTLRERCGAQACGSTRTAHHHGECVTNIQSAVGHNSGTRTALPAIELNFGLPSVASSISTNELGSPLWRASEPPGEDIDCTLRYIHLLVRHLRIDPQESSRCPPSNGRFRNIAESPIASYVTTASPSSSRFELIETSEPEGAGGGYAVADLWLLPGLVSGAEEHTPVRKPSLAKRKLCVDDRRKKRNSSATNSVTDSFCGDLKGGAFRCTAGVRRNILKNRISAEALLRKIENAVPLNGAVAAATAAASANQSLQHPRSYSIFNESVLRDHMQSWIGNKSSGGRSEVARLINHDSTALSKANLSVTSDSALDPSPRLLPDSAWKFHAIFAAPEERDPGTRLSPGNADTSPPPPLWNPSSILQQLPYNHGGWQGILKELSTAWNGGNGQSCSKDHPPVKPQGKVPPVLSQVESCSASSGSASPGFSKAGCATSVPAQPGSFPDCTTPCYSTRTAISRGPHDIVLSAFAQKSSVPESGSAHGSDRHLAPTCLANIGNDGNTYRRLPIATNHAESLKPKRHQTVDSSLASSSTEPFPTLATAFSAESKPSVIAAQPIRQTAPSGLKGLARYLFRTSQTCESTSKRVGQPPYCSLGRDGISLDCQKSPLHKNGVSGVLSARNSRLMQSDVGCDSATYGTSGNEGTAAKTMVRRRSLGHLTAECRTNSQISRYRALEGRKDDNGDLLTPGASCDSFELYSIDLKDDNSGVDDPIGMQSLVLGSDRSPCASARSCGMFVDHQLRQSDEFQNRHGMDSTMAPERSLSLVASDISPSAERQPSLGITHNIDYANRNSIRNRIVISRINTMDSQSPSSTRTTDSEAKCARLGSELALTKKDDNTLAISNPPSPNRRYFAWDATFCGGGSGGNPSGKNWRDPGVQSLRLTVPQAGACAQVKGLLRTPIVSSSSSSSSSSVIAVVPTHIPTGRSARRFSPPTRHFSSKGFNGLGAPAAPTDLAADSSSNSNLRSTYPFRLKFDYGDRNKSALEEATTFTPAALPRGPCGATGSSISSYRSFEIFQVENSGRDSTCRVLQSDSLHLVRSPEKEPLPPMLGRRNTSQAINRRGKFSAPQGNSASPPFQTASESQ